MTGVRLPMPGFLARAPDRIPTLAGLKFTDPYLMELQARLRAGGGRFDVLWGVDEYLLAAPEDVESASRLRGELERMAFFEARA
jgi:N-acetylneuraminate lyase